MTEIEKIRAQWAAVRAEKTKAREQKEYAEYQQKKDDPAYRAGVLNIKE